MAPVLSGVWWGPEAGVLGSGAAAATGVASWLGSGQLVLAITLSTLTAVLLLSVLLLLCASCKGQKKAANAHPAGDHENLMNGVSERETLSQSADSPATDAAVSSSHNGPLTSGTILTDTQDTSPQPSEEMLSSQSELRSSKCPQDRELPSIPPNNALMGEGPPASGDSTYEVVKELGSRDVSVEDSLYETVKELKDPPKQLGLPNGTIPLSPDDPPHHPPPALLNGHLSPCTPERGPLCAGVEYASVDLKKKSRNSVDMEAKRRSDNACVPSRKPLEEPEDDLPPPVPEKVLDENDNQPGMMNGLAGAGLPNGELHSPLSPAPGFHNHVLSDNESAVYSTVNKTNGDDALNEEDKEHDYSSIAELKGLVPNSSSSDLYATVRDIYTQPEESRPGEDPLSDNTDPCYETIRMPKTSSSDDDHGVGLGAEGSDAAQTEPDYESVGELGLSREASRL
ncbi:phosphoprotein associated with glycosphingolipid-enriched microdomains 1 [Labrus mixtus]|uniref:phosphoprotein associated with glycosphingolipid-enriched microdomains 1 n=1 Tax=Labrus mixtus TaxID=508554 RepID=UPI0029C09DB0|nr:phosphoprotein associated with glycosphingolipid-enriched microdomains 1 [Labrus mixtus]XP_060915121.1 phosphoprotein associated with glycosphingolipid-enriched microdomains 1 [Labrus mixtus]